MSLNEKYNRIDNDSHFKYKKPESPPGHMDNIKFKVEKQKTLMKKKEKD